MEPIGELNEDQIQELCNKNILSIKKLLHKNIIKNGYKKITNEDKEQCSICLEMYQIGLYKRNLKCGHSFHKKCIDKWINFSKSSCPICRKNL
jgi:hypothetical protein